jgi:hypothetical protein
MPESNHATVTLTANELSGLQNRLAALESEKAAQAAAAAEANARALLARGEVDAVVSQHRSEREALEKRGQQTAVISELTRALSAHSLQPAAMGQLQQLLRDDLVAETSQDGGYRVRTRDYKSVDEFVQNRLGDPAWRHFLRGNGNAPTSAPPQAANAGIAGLPAEPRNLGEACILKHQLNEQALAEKRGGRAANSDMSQAFGLPGRGWDVPRH